MKRVREGLIIAACLLVLGSSSGPAPLLAQADRQCFSETGKCVAGSFLAYWLANGGLRQQGLPISDEMQERGEDGTARTVQYFERARFEHHPRNPPEFQVLLGLLGREQYVARYQTPPLQDPLTLTGKGTLNTPPFSLAGGVYKATWQATAEASRFNVGCFHGARLQSSEGRAYSDSTGSGQAPAGSTMTGETFLYNVPAGRYYLDATSGCQWSVTLAQQR